MSTKEQIRVLLKALYAGACLMVLGAVFGALGQCEAQVFIDAQYLPVGAAIGFLCGFSAVIIEALTSEGII